MIDWKSPEAPPANEFDRPIDCEEVEALGWARLGRARAIDRPN